MTILLPIFFEDYFIFIRREIGSSPDPVKAPGVVSTNIKEFILLSVDGRRKSGNELTMILRTEEPPSSFPKIFLQHKKSMKKKNSWLKTKKMAKNNKRRKDSNGIRGKLDKNYFIQIKNIDKERMHKKLESQAEEILIDGNVAIQGADDPAIFIRHHQSILTKDVIVIL